MFAPSTSLPGKPHYLIAIKKLTKLQARNSWNKELKNHNWYPNNCAMYSFHLTSQKESACCNFERQIPWRDHILEVIYGLSHQRHIPNKLRLFPHPRNMIIWNYYKWRIQYYIDLNMKGPSLSLSVSIIYTTVYLDSAKNLYTAGWKNTGFSCFDVWSSETTLTSLIAHVCPLPLL